MLFDYDLLMNLSNINLNNNNSLVDSKLGLQRGNLFENEYKPYKNYNPKNINIDNDLLLKLYENYFAIIDLNQYLDLHPEDTKVFDLFKSYLNNYEDLKKMYEIEYGPLEITCLTNKYDWLNNPWPWDNGGNKYV